MIRAGLIGLGWWGSSLLRMLEGSRALSFCATTDIDPSRREIAERHGVEFLDGFEAVLEHPLVEAIVLCTPHEAHAQQIVAAARAGKHVFCEKPLCLKRADAERAITACRTAGVQLGVGHERRFEPPIIELMARISRGDLGTIVQVEGNFNQDKFLALPADNWRVSGKDTVGPMTATGIHVLDLSTALLGRASSVLAVLRRLAASFENGDSLALMVSFETGVVALVSAVLTTPFDGRFAVYGSKGWAEIRDKSHPENSEGWVATYVLRDRPREVIDYPGAPSARFNLEAFARAAAGIAPYPIATDQMLLTVEALEAVFESAKSGAIAFVR